ncbi:MAG: hypothetical protein Q9210_004974 [Variospora velana]
MLQQREEADHRRDALGSTTASQSLHVAADLAVPGEVDQVEEQQPIQPEPSTEPADLSIGQDPWPAVVSAEVKTRPDQRPATPDVPTEEDPSSSEQDLPRSSGTYDSEEDDSDLSLPAKIERFLNDLPRKERAKIFECIGDNYRQVLDQGYAEGCARGEVRLWYLQQRLEAQRTKVVSAMGAQHVSDLKALKDMTARCEDLSRQLEERTAECQDLQYRNAQLNAQHIQIKRISELKQRKPQTISFATTLGKTPNRPKSPLAPRGEPSSPAAKRNEKMPVGAKPGEADVRSLKTTPAKPEHEESCPLAFPMPTRVRAPVERLTKRVTPPDPSNTSTTAPTSSVSPSESVLAPAPSTASSSLPSNPKAKALGNGTTEVPTTASPSASSKSSALSSNNGPTTARGTAKSVLPPNSSATPTNSGPATAPAIASSAAAPNSSASSTRAGPARASGTTPSLAVSNANAGPTNSGPSAATGTASLSVPSTSAAGATNTGLVTAPATAQSLPPATLHHNAVFTVNASHVDDLTARLGSVKLEDEHVASEPEVAANSTLLVGPDQIDPYDVPLPATPTESVAGGDQEAPRADQLVRGTSTLIGPEPVDPYDVPLPQTPARSVDGDAREAVVGTTTPATDKPGDTFMTNSAFNGEDDRTTASHHRGTLDLKLEWCPKTTRRARRSLKKRTVSFSAHASTLLKLERKQRRFSNFMVKLPRLGEVPLVKKPTKSTRTRLMIVDRPDHSSRKWAHEQWLRSQYEMDWEW